mgnify:CR=1 FL=1
MAQTTELTDRYLALVRAERECESGLEHDYGTCAAGCKDGKVPLLPGLRMLCKGPAIWPRQLKAIGCKGATCKACGGLGYQPVPLDRDTVEVALKEAGYPPSVWWDHLENHWVGEVAKLGPNTEVLLLMVIYSNDSPTAALLGAACKALGVEVAAAGKGASAWPSVSGSVTNLFDGIINLGEVQP